MGKALLAALAISIAVIGLVVVTTETSPAEIATSTTNTSYQASALKPNDTIIAVAKTKLGTPYGSGPGSLTCSEYTQLVYRRALGASIAGTPGGQLASGWQPRKTKRGDLLFYDEAGYGRMTHVAIYMGKGKIIHASNYFGDVHISYSRYMDYAYVTTRRIR